MRRILMAALAMNLLACASKLEGPSPKVTSVAPAQICTAQRAVTIVVSGEGFSPVVADALTSTPRVLMPTVALVSAQTPTPVPAEGVALPAGTHDGRSLSVTIPAMLVGPRSATEASAVYDLSVTNPNGNGNTLAGAITILPPPTLTDVRPVEICSEIMSTLMLTGSNFRPGATVTIATSPTTTLGPLGITVSGDGTTATVTVPAAALANGGPYEVTIINPEAGGCSASRPMALTVEPAPTLTSVMPGTGAGGTTVNLDLVGTTFLPGMSVRLEATPAVSASMTTVVSRTSATAVLDLTGVAAGTYGVTVQNADGCSFTLPGAFVVTPPKIITISGIDPPFGCTCETTAVTIKGAGLVSTPVVTMRPTGMPAATPVTFQRVAFIDSGTLTALVPAGITPLGSHDVTITNPPSDGSVGTLASAFRVVANPVPRIFNVEPGRGTTGTDQPVVVSGANFRSQVKFELLNAAGVSVFASAPITLASSPTGSFNFTIPISSTPALGEGVYLVRVTNLDEMTYSTYSFFVIKNPSAKLSTFSAGIPRPTGRRELAAVLASDDLGNKYVYAIGGANGAGTSLETLEASALSRFGDLGAWRTLPASNSMQRKRRGLAVVAVPVFKTSPTGIDVFVPERTYLYALGGRDGTTVERTVERAVVLRNADAPVATGTASAGGGTLAAGTWYYKVSAVLAASDPDNPGGETLTSDEVIVGLSAAGSVTLSWPAKTVNGMAAAGYRIYRTDAPDGVSQQEHLIDTVTGTSYTDTGHAAGTVPFLPSGATGVWVVQTPQLASARAGVSAVTATDPTGARFIYAIAGRSAATGGLLNSVEKIAVDAQGQLGGAWSSAGGNLIDTRAYAGADVETRANVSTFLAAPNSRLWVAGGVGQVNATGNVGALIGLEFADVTTGGDLTAWSHQIRSGAAVYDISAAAGGFFAISSNQLFAVGGAGTATDTGFGAIRSGPGDKIDFGAAGALVGAASSSSNGPTSPLALGGTVRSTGLLYFIGGTSDGNDAVTTTFRTLN